jgi:D-hydroxyproline dehydrogenase subunit alpha
MSSDAMRAEVVVVGAGPAGLAATTRAARAGRRVLLLDEAPRPGGQVWRHRTGAALPGVAARWLDALHASGAKVMSGATVADIGEGGTLLVEVNGRPLTVTASRAVILCTGARELLLPFPGWTLPGVVGVGGAQALLKQGLDVSGRRVVIAGSGPLLLPVAAALARAGARVALVAEQATAAAVIPFVAGLWRTPGRLLDAARYRASFARTRYRTGTWVTAAEGDERVRAARLSDGSVIPCDLLCVGYGLVPATELPRLAGCAISAAPLFAVQVDATQRTTVPHIFCAGEPTGIAGMEAAVTQGEIAGLAAAGEEVPQQLLRQRDARQRFAGRMATSFRLRPELRQLARPDTIICRCEDVPLSRLDGCGSAREARLHTRAGMGACQGRVCGAALHFLRGWSDGVNRPPSVAVRVSTLSHAGDGG